MILPLRIGRTWFSAGSNCKLCCFTWWSPADDREIFSLKELEEVFDYHRINKSPAVFDIVKLRWMNGEYIKAMSDDAYYEHALPINQKSDYQRFGFEKNCGFGKNTN